MSARLSTIWVTLVVAAGIAQENAFSQSGFGLGPQIGLHKSKGGDDVRVMIGGAARVRLSEALGIEGSINYRQDEFDNGIISVTSWPIMVTGLIYPLPIVYGAIGVGWYNTTVEYNFPPGFLGGPANFDDQTTQEFGWHFGGGAELPLSPDVSLVGDIRYVFLDYDFQSFPGSDVSSNFFVITAGMLFMLH